jgi:hypothetical protein
MAEPLKILGDVTDVQFVNLGLQTKGSPGYKSALDRIIKAGGEELRGVTDPIEKLMSATTRYIEKHGLRGEFSFIHSRIMEALAEGKKIQPFNEQLLSAMNQGIELERAARLGPGASSKSSSTSSASSTSRLKGVPSKPVDLSEDFSRVGAADDVLDFGEEFGSIRFIDAGDDVADEVTPVIKKTEPVITGTTPPKKEVEIAAPKASDASVGPVREEGARLRGTLINDAAEAVKTEGVEPVTTGTTPPKKEKLTNEIDYEKLDPEAKRAAAIQRLEKLGLETSEANIFAEIRIGLKEETNDFSRQWNERARGQAPRNKEVKIAAPKASDASVGPVREEGARLRGTLINDAAEAVKTEGVEPVTKRVGPPPPESGTTLRNVGTEPAQPTLRGTGLAETVYSGALSHEEQMDKIQRMKDQKEAAAKRAQEKPRLEAEKKERKAARRAHRQARKAAEQASKNPGGIPVRRTRRC